MKDLFKNKASGFRGTLACIALAVVTAVVYAIIYSSSRFMSWTGFGIMLGGAVAAAVLVVLKLHRFAPALLLATNFVGLLFHVYYISFFITSVVTGIQYSEFPVSFFVNFILMGLTLVLSIACVFLPVDETTQEVNA